MKVSVIVLIATLLTSGPTLVNAQEEGQPKDREAISSVAQTFFEATKNHDVQAENKVVHPKAKWIFASKDNRLYIRNQEQGTKALKQKASRGTVLPPATLKIGSMDITGDAASLKMEIEFPRAVSTYYLILLKLAGEWKIVGGTVSARQK